jgi:hypothetical protein
MAHFARIKQVLNSETNEQDWVVQEVIVASNDISTAEGPLGENDMHVDGETYVANMFKHMYSENENVWKQTSYNQTFRNRFAGKGDIFLETADKFISPKPYDSWHLSNETFNWVAPIEYPSVVDYDNPLAGQDIVDENGVVIGTQPQKAEYKIMWKEDLQKWQAMASHLEINAMSHEWNPDTETWVEL